MTAPPGELWKKLWNWLLEVPCFVVCLCRCRPSPLPGGIWRIFTGSSEGACGGFSRAELEDHLSAVAQKPRYMACLAVDIMLELGFAQEEKGIKLIQAPVQRDLMESKLYAAIAALSQ